MQPHTRRRGHVISHHPHSFALVHASRFSSASSPKRTLSHPLSTIRLSLSPSLSPLFFYLRLSRELFEVTRNLASTDTSFRISCNTAALIFTRRSCNLLIAIEQLSNRKLFYSCSLGPFSFSTVLILVSRTHSFYVFFISSSPLRRRAFTRVPFQAPDCTTNRIKSGIREKVIL